MKITYLGTGAAEGVPAMFCSCKFCVNMRKNSPGEYRARTQVLIDGKLCVDFPPEAYTNSMRFGVDLSALKFLLVTHSHMDHFYAHDFILRGYKYADIKENVLNIYGNEEVFKVFYECTARELKEEVGKHLRLSVLHPYEMLRLGEYKILTLPASHGTKEEALLYYIEKGNSGYLHLYDTGDLCDEAVNYLSKNGARAKLVSLDCTFLDEPHVRGARHMGIEDCMEVKAALINCGVADKNTKFVITHFSHHANPTKQKLSKIESKYSLTAAYDGMSIEI